jgi:hypothetical protein
MKKTRLTLLVLISSFSNAIAVAELTQQEPVWIPEHFPEMLPIKAGSFMMAVLKPVMRWKGVVMKMKSQRIK